MNRFSFLFAIVLSLSFITSLSQAAGSRKKMGLSPEQKWALALPKMNFMLERAFAEAEQEDGIENYYIVGILRTSVHMESTDAIKNLFNDPSFQVGTIIAGAEGDIVTFSSSLAGVLNAGSNEAVAAIQMSKRIDGTAGVTIRN